MGLIYNCKPRIKRFREHYSNDWQWICSGGWHIAIAKNPVNAYYRWKHKMYMMGIKIAHSGSRKP